MEKVEKTQTKASNPNTEKPAPNALALIDALDQIDVELRKARQIISEFYDDIVVNESYYPTFDNIFNSRTPNDLVNTPLFKLINDYPRYVTLLEIATEHLGEGHLIALNALVDAGKRENNRSYVIG